MSIGAFSSVKSAFPNADADMYTDLNSLQKIKQLGRGDSADKNQAMEAVAKQFESVFLNMMMKSMRDANEAFKDESMSSSNEMDFYQNMFDQQLALTLSKDGIGIADALMRQLKGRLPQPEAAAKVDGSQNPFDLYENIRKLIDSGKLISSERPKEAVPAQSESVEASVKTNNILSSVDFKEKLFPLAQKAAKALGVEPEVILSQAALETGWGQHMINKQNGDSSFNLFGIKANNGWQGEVASVKTLEYQNGIAQPQRANFRSYASYEESFDDYVAFIKNSSRYQNALKDGNSSDDYIRHLQQAGYATDPHYADKILGIVDQHFGERESKLNSGRQG
jgi:peptidoglycan hydrolase FlgJ